MIKDSLKDNTHYFDSFENREEAFNRSISRLIPCKYNGPRRFWNEFSRIVQHRLPEIRTQSTAYITSNPRDCLAFGTAGQVLTAARLMAMSATQDAIPEIEAVASRFDLSGLLNQPIRTLSGGEMVKLALAKTCFLAYRSRKLSIASPFCWLSRRNLPLLKEVVHAYQTRDVPVRIYALDGEDELDDRPLQHLRARIDHGPQFLLRSRNARVVLGSGISEIAAAPQSAAICDVQLQLVSPCLIKGDNGQGKSLVARALSRAIKTRGELFVGGPNGSSMLLFQDVINQTLLRSFNTLLRSQHCAEEAAVKTIFETIWFDYHRFAEISPEEAPTIQNRRRSTLLSIKMLLVALRLCRLPDALILDEPDWGLTRSSSEALVMAVIRCAHNLSVPVLIISHKPWWKTLAKSCLLVKKIPPASASKNSTRFTIGLEKFTGK